ncbi:hypothetical protein W822_20160 [Advenella kashmirensis W13003]|uniref:DUF1566 domain-containing protein n=1 Tax=Advenella kashmirensis W13003 TaxID=1424334 RepID=V8QN10_9BURK|nr:hypothetical protein [Advenella kashmirensis]ETF00695.1 hypothetical protein W822_20160 [Advenella kashmirensis W13003]
METIQIEEVRKAEVPATPGTAFAGGFYFGQINIDGQLYALVVAPKESGQFIGKWSEHYDKIESANSVSDGFKNTLAMADAGSDIAKRALGLTINGQVPWYIPARDELEQVYRHLKPTTRENYCSWRDGENANAVPATDVYREDLPEQTAATEFQEEGAEAMDAGWHWSSTQVSATGAAIQFFNDGSQNGNGKDIEFRVRVVRRLKIL